MKTCPICGARAFDDAEVCYGCLHRYEGADMGAPGPAVLTAPPEPAAPAVPAASPGPAVPVASPCASAPSGDAGWVVRFELPGYESVVDADGRAGFVVRFRPEAPCGPDERRRVVAARGTHARDAPAPRAAMPERS